MKVFRLFVVFIGAFAGVMGISPVYADLTGYYYNWTGDAPPANPFTGQPLLTRIDPKVDFNFDANPAPAPIGVDKFAVRWHGMVFLPKGGHYVFYGRSDDGTRLYIDGGLNVKQWVERGDPGFPGSAGTGMTLAAGWHDVVYEFYENGGAAMAQMNWSGAGMADKETVPAYRLKRTNDLRVCLPLSMNGDGTASDYSGDCHNGSLVGAPGLRTGHDGTPNGAFTFNGSSQYIKVNNSPYVFCALANRGFTVSTWIYLTAYPTATNTVVYQNRGPDTGAQRSLTLGFFAKNMQAEGDDVTSRISFGVDAEAILIGVYTEPNAISLNAWHHVVGTWNGPGEVNTGQFKIYVDGVKMATKGWGTGTAPVPPLVGRWPVEIGHHEAWKSFFPGSVDDVRIFDKELSEDEIQGLFSGASPATGPYVGPSVVSIERVDPTPIPVEYSSVDYKVNFNQPVQTLVPWDFSVEAVGGGTATANVASISAPSVNIGPLGFETLGGGTLGGPGAALLTAGGQGDNGPCLQLTPNQGSMNGIWYIQSPAIAKSFRASFSLYVNNPPNNNGADGFEFTYGASGNGGQGPEGPGGKGVTVCFDTWNNDTENPGGSDGFPANTATSKPKNGDNLTYGNIVVKCNGQVVGNYVNYLRFESGEWIPVVIEVTDNGAAGAMCNVRWGAQFTPVGVNTPTPPGWIHCNVPLNGYSPEANWYFGIGAATGGANDAQWVDNLHIVSADRTVTLNTLRGSGLLRMNLNDTDSSIKNYDNAPIVSTTWAGAEPYEVDNDPPPVTISAPSSALTKSGPVTYTVSYEGATSISLSAKDILLNKTGSANGLVNVSGSGTVSRTVTISGISGDGTLGIRIAAGTAVDARGNRSYAAGPSAVFVVDNTGPSAVFSVPSVALTKSGPVSYTVTYNDAASVVLTAGQVVLNKTGTANGTVGVSGTGNSTRTVTISGVTGDGTLGISLAPGTALDSLGNLAPAAGPSAVFTADNTGPPVWISAPSVPLTKSGPVTYTVSYADAVNVTLDPAKIVLNRMDTANGVVTVEGAGNLERTVTLSGITGEGMLSISIIAGTAVDSVGNNAQAMGPSVTVKVDNERPACVVSTASSDPALVQPIPFQLAFNEPVFGLEPADITAGNGVVTGITGGPAMYEVMITPATAPPASVSVAVTENAVRDAAGNLNTASNTASVTYTNEQPACAVTAPSDAANASPILFTLQFNKTMTWVDQSKVVVTNGTKGTMLGLGTTFTLPVTPLGQGAVTCEVLAGAAQDSSMRLNQASNRKSVEYDLGRPACTVSSTTPATNANPIELTITFTEPVSGLTTGGIDVVNASKGSLTERGAGVYTLPVTPSAPGEVRCQVQMNAAADAAGNGNTVSNTLVVAYDPAAPSCVVTGPSSPTDQNPLVFTVTFDEAVTDLTASKMLVTGGLAAATLNTSDNRVYTLEVTPSGQGSVTCQVPAGAARDAGGNLNTASNAATAVYQSDRPTCLVTGLGSVVNVSPIVFTLTFSEAVTGLVEEEILVSNAARRMLRTTDNTVFTLEVTPSGQCVVNCQVLADAARDADNHGNTVSNRCEVRYDSTAPVCTVNGAAVTNTAPMEFSITFDEDVAGLSADSIVVTNARKGIVFGNGARYILPVMPLGQGAVTCQVAAEAARDAAGNANSASNFASINYDSVHPKCTVMAPFGPVHTAPLVFTISFDEPVNTLSASNLKLTNAIVSGSLIGSGAGPYTLSVIPLAVGDVKCQVLEEAVRDTAGNGNLPSGEASVYYDNPNPACWITGPDRPVNDAPIVFNIHFSAPVTGLTADEVAVTNGAKGTLSGSGMSYSIPVTPSVQGMVTCQVPEGAAQDSGARANTESSICKVLYDTAPPTGTLVLGGTTPATADLLTFVMAFNEEVGDTFTHADIALEGTLAAAAYVSNVLESGNTYTVEITLNDPDLNGTLRMAVGTQVYDPAGNAFAGAVSPEYRVRNWFGFTDLPLDTHCYLGGNNLFTVAAAHGKGSVSYQWWRNTSGKAVTPISGAVQTAYSISPVTQGDAGLYQCVATYDGAEFETGWVSLDVAEHLRITKDLPPGGEYPRASDLTLKVETQGGFQPLSHVWTQNGLEISNDPVLQLPSLGEESNGTYQVTVSDAYQEDSVVSAAMEVTVDMNTVPLAGLMGIAALTGVIALLGVRRARKP